eukprot:9482681-Pyramimonas_sp.AAC.1
MYGCMSNSKYNDDPRDRPDIIRVATEFILEYLSTSPATTPLDKDSIHDVPPGLSVHVDKIKNQPFDRIPTHGSWGWILLAVREVI